MDTDETNNRQTILSRFLFRSTNADLSQLWRPTESDSDQKITSVRSAIAKKIGFTPENEEEWRDAMTYVLANVNSNKDGGDGDIPLPSAFATEPEFWKAIFVLFFVGGIIGLVSNIFLNIVKKIPEMWIDFNWNPSSDDDFFSCAPCSLSNTTTSCSCQKYLNCEFYSGSTTWIIITTLSGLVVGLIRYVTSYPEIRPGIFKEIVDFYVDPVWSPVALLISAVSLAGGACLGPEQALSNIGGGLTVYLIDKCNAYYGLPLMTPNSPNFLPPQNNKNSATNPDTTTSSSGVGEEPNNSIISISQRSRYLSNEIQNVIHEKWNGFRNFSFTPTYQKIMVLGGIASALGSLFPTPLLAVTMMQELGRPPKNYMESTLIIAVPACTAFLCYYSLLDKTYISSLSATSQILSIEWKFTELNCMVGIAIGVVSAALGLTELIFIGISKQILNRIRTRFSFSPFLRTIIPPMLVGVIIGVINWALPLTVGNGEMLLGPLITYVAQGRLSAKLLICSAFAKMFLLGLSMHGGFVGGFVFPTITISIIAGCVTHIYYPFTPLGLCLSCFLAGVPSSITPMPVTFVVLSCFIFYLGLYQSAPVFLASIVSHSLVCGTGILGEMMKRGRAVDAAAKKQSEMEMKTSPVSSPASSVQSSLDLPTYLTMIEEQMSKSNSYTPPSPHPHSMRSIISKPSTSLTSKPMLKEDSSPLPGVSSHSVP